MQKTKQIDLTLTKKSLIRENVKKKKKKNVQRERILLQISIYLWNFETVYF